MDDHSPPAPVSRRHSLRWRLPILVSTLIAVLLGAFLWISYRELRGELVDAAGARAGFAADQIGEVLATATRQRLVELRQAAGMAEMQQFLLSPTEPVPPMVTDVLQALADENAARLVSADGRVVAEVGQGLPAARGGYEVGARLRADGSGVVAELVSDVPVGPAMAPLGYVVVQRPLGSPATIDLLMRMVGASARFVVGLDDGSGLWTDFSAAAPGPPRTTVGTAEYRHPSGEWRLGALSTVADTPWLVWVDFGADEVLQPARTALLRMSVLAVGLIVLAALISAALGVRITRPLVELTVASEALARGDDAVTLPASGADEVGRLARAFRLMVDRVHEAHARLEDRIREGAETLGVLRDSQATLRATVDLSLDGIVCMDVDGLVTEFNPAAEAIFGYRREEVIGQDMAALLIPPQYQELHRRGLARFLETGQGAIIGHRTELVGMRKDGTQVPVELAVQTLGGSAAPTFIAYVGDITDRRKAEEARIRSVELQAENRRVREASRLKSEFLANMSHELRTPLNSIIGFSSLLKEGRIELSAEDRAEFLGHIQSSGEHLLQLINDVLDLSRIEAGKVRFHPQPVHLDELVASVADAMSGKAAAKGITVALHVPPPLTDATLDPGRFRQVLYNFLSNALKFTPKDGRVDVRVLPEDAGRAIRLEVADSGIGISQDDQARLFVEFEQLDPGMAKEHEGTGLGLALTKRLVEAQGGRVGVRSTPGEGSVFHAVLPRHQAATTPAASDVAAGPDGAPLILVVEDNPEDRQYLLYTLVSGGYRVLAVERAAEALEVSRRHFIDAVTLDLVLPDQSGLELLAQLRQRGRNPDVPVVVVTVIAEKSAVAGHVVADVLSKPIDAARLLGSLRRAVPTPNRKRVLVVDDDEASLRLAEVALTEAGCDVEVFADPFEALRVAGATPPAAIVLDLLMPGLSGFEFLERLRQAPATRATPVIVWTVKDLQPDEAVSLAQHARSVVQKVGHGADALLRELQAVLPNQPPGTA